MNYQSGEKVELMDEVQVENGATFTGFVVGFDKVNDRTFVEVRVKGTEGDAGKIWATDNTLTLIHK